MTEKKVVLLIVEGSSDERVLSSIIREMNAVSTSIQFELVRGDAFTSNSSAKGKAVVSAVISSFITRTKIPAKQIAFVGYILDVDGIYIKESDVSCEDKRDDDYFQYDSSSEQVVFGSKEKMENVQAKWVKKQSRVNELQSNDFTIKMREHAGTSTRIDIPVQIYFNNITLEHVLVNKILRGMDAEDEKKQIIRAFSKRIASDETPFETAKVFFQKLVPANATNNKQSWDKIKQNPWEHSSSIYFLLMQLGLYYKN